MVGKYPVITLCGSTRFKEQFLEAQKRLTLAGNIVISVGLFGHSGDDEVWTEGTKEMLDDMYGDNNTIERVVSWNGINIPDNTVFAFKIIVENATLGGLSYRDRVDVDPELGANPQYLLQRCADGANKRFRRGVDTHPIHFIPKDDGTREYRVTFILRSVTERGYTIADAWTDTPSGAQAQITGLRGPGGYHGSFVNLMGDGMESLGSELAKLICKARNGKKI